MRIYKDPLEAVKEIQRDLIEMGILTYSKSCQDKLVTPEEHTAKELYAYSYTILDNTPVKRLALIDFFHLNLKYLNLEHRARFRKGEDIGSLNPGRAYKERLDVWEEYLHSDGKFAYTYPERIGGVNIQIERVCNELLKNPQSRRAIISIYEGMIDRVLCENSSRIPCSMYYQFLIREIDGENKLIMIYNMRSCDFYMHFGYDLYLALHMQGELSTLLFPKLNVTCGPFIHSIGSLHIFKKDWEKVEKEKGGIF